MNTPPLCININIVSDDMDAAKTTGNSYRQSNDDNAHRHRDHGDDLLHIETTPLKFNNHRRRQKTDTFAMKAKIEREQESIMFLASKLYQMMKNEEGHNNRKRKANELIVDFGDRHEAIST